MEETDLQAVLEVVKDLLKRRTPHDLILDVIEKTELCCEAVG